MQSIDALLEQQLGLLALVYGRSGSGKTASWGHLPPDKGVVLLSEPNGVRTIKRMFPESYQNFSIEVPERSADFVNHVKRLIHTEVGWVVIDTVTAYYAKIWDEFLDEKGLAPSEVKYANYAHCLHWFNNFMIRLTDLANSGTAVFLTCHEKWHKEGDDDHAIRWVTPDLPGQLPELVSRRLDVLCRSELVKLGSDVRYRLSLPVGRNAGKDLLGVFDNGPIANDLSSFFHLLGGGVGKAISESATQSSIATKTPPPPTSPKNRVPKAQLQLLQSYMVNADVDMQWVKQWCHDNYGKEAPENLTTKQFAQLQGVLLTRKEAKETL